MLAPVSTFPKNWKSGGVSFHPIFSGYATDRSAGCNEPQRKGSMRYALQPKSSRIQLQEKGKSQKQRLKERIDLEVNFANGKQSSDKKMVCGDQFQDPERAYGSWWTSRVIKEFFWVNCMFWQASNLFKASTHPSIAYNAGSDAGTAYLQPPDADRSPASGMKADPFASLGSCQSLIICPSQHEEV